MWDGFMRSMVAMVCIVAVAACGGGLAGDGAVESVQVTGPRVNVVDHDFEPERIEVVAGETVTWVWEGRANHDVVGEDFSSEVQRTGTFAHAFAAVGEHPYRCSLHPGMDGVVAVSGS